MSPARRSPPWKRPSCWRSWTITGSETRTPIRPSVSRWISWDRPPRSSPSRLQKRDCRCRPTWRARCSPGLLADTLILTSPTTTQRDKDAAQRLARWAFVGSSPLKGETIDSYGKAVLSAGAGLSNRTPEQIVSNDIKPYEAGGFHLAIAQAEVTDLVQLSEHLEPLTKALNDLRDKRGLHFAMLLITDVVRGSSRLLISSNPPPILADLPYPPLPDGTRDAPGVVSRKKQLLPVVLGLLER